MPMNVQAVYASDLSTRYALPVFLGRLPAGFPSPADDYLEGKLDLNRHLIKHPARRQPAHSSASKTASKSASHSLADCGKTILTCETSIVRMSGSTGKHFRAARA